MVYYCLHIPVLFGAKATEHGRSRQPDDRALVLAKNWVSFIAVSYKIGKKICMMEEGWLQTVQVCAKQRRGECGDAEVDAASSKQVDRLR
jgi:hypothetical protein